MFSLLEGPQQSAPTAAAAAAAAEAMTGNRVFPDVLSEGVAEAHISSAGAAPAAEPAAAPATGGTVFPTASVGGVTRAPAPADETAASKAAPTTSDKFNDWGGRGCNIFVPVSGGDVTIIAPTGDIFYQHPGQMQ